MPTLDDIAREVGVHQDDHERFAARAVPVVVAARPLPLYALPQVIPDDAAGARLAAGHLAGLGHRRVAQLRGPLDVASFEQRAVAFSHACTELGMEEVAVAGHASRPVFEEGERLASPRRFLPTTT